MSRVHIVSQTLHTEIVVCKRESEQLRKQVETLTKRLETIENKRSDQKIFKVTDIKESDLGLFKSGKCINCGEVGCSLMIDWYCDLLPFDHSITFHWDWKKDERTAMYIVKCHFDSRYWEEDRDLLIPNGAKIKIRKAHFECAKSYSVKGSIPSLNCSHGGGCSCGRKNNDVTELIQKEFDRLCDV